MQFQSRCHAREIVKATDEDEDLQRLSKWIREEPATETEDKQLCKRVKGMFGRVVKELTVTRKRRNTPMLGVKPDSIISKRRRGCLSVKSAQVSGKQGLTASR